MIPKALEYRSKSATLELVYAEGKKAELSAEYLRVHSPSAEVQGHHPSEAVLQTGKRWVKILRITPVGNYAVQLHFDDGHDTGIYSWDFLWDLYQNQSNYWQQYLDNLSQAGERRDPDE